MCLLEGGRRRAEAVMPSHLGSWTSARPAWGARMDKRIIWTKAAVEGRMTKLKSPVRWTQTDHGGETRVSSHQRTINDSSGVILQL